MWISGSERVEQFNGPVKTSSRYERVLNTDETLQGSCRINIAFRIFR